jgi:uncharacterized protein (DUF2336 family)
MPFETTTSISGDLARVADRVACDVTLTPEFCERLTRALSQLWSAGGAAMRDDDRARFDSILVRIVPTTTVGARSELSDCIARSAEPPRGVLLILAHDEIDIAAPILRLSPALADEDLVDIARRCGTPHMSAIAQRPELSIRVTDVLVLRGDDDVRRVVVANPRARLSDKSFARLSLQTRDDGALGLVLVGRLDLPDLVVRFLEANGSAEIRRALRDREDHPRESAHTHVAKSIRRAEDGWLEPYDFDEAKAVLTRLPEAPQQIDAYLRRLAHTDRFAEIVVVLSMKSGIPLELVKHMLVSLDTEPFVKVARALGLRNETVQEILMIGPWLHRLDARAREAAMLAFQTTDVDEARSRVRRWAGETN